MLVRAVQHFVLYLLIFIWTFCLFWFLQFQTYLLWAAPSLHPSYTIKFSLQIPLSISKPSFCSGAALVHFPPHFSAPEFHTFGCVIQIKQSNHFLLTFRHEDWNHSFNNRPFSIKLPPAASYRSKNTGSKRKLVSLALSKDNIGINQHLSSVVVNKLYLVCSIRTKIRNVKTTGCVLLGVIYQMTKLQEMTALSQEIVHMNPS